MRKEKVNQELDFKNFPTTRYQGSKRKILPWIHEQVKDLKFETVLDGCGGSGSVSYLFKKMNKTVTYNDNLKFNYLLGKALIENSKTVFTTEDCKNLYKLGEEKSDFIQRTFKGIYYPENENRWLDEMSQGIFCMNHYTGKVLEFKKALVFYALCQSSMIKRPFNLFHRRNLSVRTNDVKRKFGNKVTWEKDFKTVFESFLSEINRLVFDNGKKCKSINQSIFDIKNVDFDLVYLDPPYINQDVTNETANYLKCYHFLEGLANYEQWESFIDFESRNLRFKDSLLSTRFHKANIYESYDFLFEKFKKSILVVSYKTGGIPSVTFLVNKMKKYKKHVSVCSKPYVYALNTQNGNESRNREILIIGK